MMGVARECFVITVPRSAVVMAHAVTAFSPPMQILRMVGHPVDDLCHLVLEPFEAAGLIDGVQES